MSSYPVLRYTQARTDHDESILSSSASSYWDASHVENHPWLYIGSLSAAAESNDHLQSNNITRILTVASGRLNVSKATLPPCVNEHCTVGIDDHPRANFLNDAAEQCCEFINAAHADFESYMKKDIGTNNSSLHDKTPPSILVHCASGVSRSATAILIWLMSRSSEPSNTTTTTTTLRPTNQRQTLDEALGSIRQLRPTIHPNIGFMMQLGILDQCNGDLRKAKLQWNTHCKGDAYDIVSAQRQKANDMHARVDELEVRIQSNLFTIKNNNKTSNVVIDDDDVNNEMRKKHNSEILLQELGHLSHELGFKSIGGNHDISIIPQDRVAKIISKSAQAKIERLISLVSST